MAYGVELLVHIEHEVPVHHFCSLLLLLHILPLLHGLGHRLNCFGVAQGSLVLFVGLLVHNFALSLHGFPCKYSLFVRIYRDCEGFERKLSER